MEFAFALGSFVALVVAWLVMPGTRRATAVETTHSMEGLQPTA